MNREDISKIAERIRKLLALGTSSNEHEAALAVSKAQALLQQYDLSMESIENLKADPRTSIGRQSSGLQTREGKPEGWKADLLHAVAETSDCAVATTYEYERTKSGKHRLVTHYNVIGFLHDVEMVGYSTAFLIGEVERLAQVYADRMWAEIRDLERRAGITHQQAEAAYVRQTGRHPLKAKLYFIRGAAERLVDDLRSQYYERQMKLQEGNGGNPYALVVQKKSAVADWISMERHGMTVAEYRKLCEEQHAKWVAEHPEEKETPAETPAERAKREAREERAYQREQARREREWKRQYRATDHAAVRDGRVAGAGIRVHKGLNGGSGQDSLPG